VFIFEKFKKVTIGEVVPAREGLRLLNFIALLPFNLFIGEVVPAREGLRLYSCNLIIGIINLNRRSGSSKRRIKTLNNPPSSTQALKIGEVVPAREGLRQFHPCT